jgi:putative transposase
MLKLAERALGRSKSRAYKKTAASQAHGLEKAQRWLQEGLAAAGLTDQKERLRTRGSDPRKIALAQLLWRRTTVSQVWLAERLGMRSAANVSQLLRRGGPPRHNARLPKPLRAFLSRASAE